MNCHETVAQSVAREMGLMYLNADTGEVSDYRKTKDPVDSDPEEMKEGVKE